SIFNGAPTDALLEPINSDPIFGLPGYAFWGPDGVSGVAIYSNEFGSLGYSSDDLLELRWRNRNNNSGPGNPTNNDWRGLVYVNGIWYASQTTVNVNNTAANTFEDEVLNLSGSL
ncbi:MAG TPA: hypothetical protein PLZ32_12145, partial [Saprospiraceae bacterium]|nr:hypothetical protein [Saprospiraceae bacterium]